MNLNFSCVRSCCRRCVPSPKVFESVSVPTRTCLVVSGFLLNPAPLAFQPRCSFFSFFFFFLRGTFILTARFFMVLFGETCQVDKPINHSGSITSLSVFISLSIIFSLFAFKTTSTGGLLSTGGEPRCWEDFSAGGKNNPFCLPSRECFPSFHLCCVKEKATAILRPGASRASVPV